MRTIGDALQAGHDRLATSGIDDPELEARLLLASVLDLPHLELGLRREHELTPDDAARFASFLARRAEREPLQLIVGDVAFYGRLFAVRPGVFIPRPETEVVAEVALGQLAAGEPSAVAEIGSGTGVLAVTIAAERPQASIVAIDADPRAVALTGDNARALGVGERVAARKATFPDGLDQQFDLIVSNPPYVPTRVIASLEIEVARHDPRLALDGGADGLVFYRLLFQHLPRSMRAGAPLVVELGDEQAPPVRAIAQDHGWHSIVTTPDLTGRTRVLTACCACD